MVASYIISLRRKVLVKCQGTKVNRYAGGPLALTMLSRIAADRMWGLFWCGVIHHDVLMMVAVGTRPLPFLLLIHPFSLTCFWLLTRSPHLVTRDNDNTCPEILSPILHDNSGAGEGQGATWGELSTALYWPVSCSCCVECRSGIVN